MKLYCSGMQKPHRKKRFLFVRRTTPRSGGTLRAAFYSACTLILHASHGNVNVHFAQIRPAFRSAVCGTRVRAAGLSAEKTRAGRENGRGGRDFRFGRDGERKVCLRTDKGAGELNILCTPSIRPRFPARRRTARAFFACRREETAFLPRTGEPNALSVRCRTDCVSLIRRRTDVRKNAARQDAPAARRFFRRVRPPSPFCRTAFGSAGAAGAAHGSSKFSKKPTLAFLCNLKTCISSRPLCAVSGAGGVVPPFCGSGSFCGMVQAGRENGFICPARWRRRPPPHRRRARIPFRRPAEPYTAGQAPHRFFRLYPQQHARAEGQRAAADQLPTPHDRIPPPFQIVSSFLVYVPDVRFAIAMPAGICYNERKERKERRFR